MDTIVRKASGRWVLHLVVRSLALALCLVSGILMSVAEAQPNDEVNEEQRCLALTMYWEARGEGVESMQAVGSVVLNRIESPEFPDSVCGVVYEGGETPPCQFSWWCDGRSDVPREREVWQRALDLAQAMLISGDNDPTQGALFFHHTDMSEPWNVERTRTVVIGSHVYYR